MRGILFMVVGCILPLYVLMGITLATVFGSPDGIHFSVVHDALRMQVSMTTVVGMGFFLFLSAIGLIFGRAPAN